MRYPIEGTNLNRFRLVWLRRQRWPVARGHEGSARHAGHFGGLSLFSSFHQPTYTTLQASNLPCTLSLSSSALVVARYYRLFGYCYWSSRWGCFAACLAALGRHFTILFTLFSSPLCEETAHIRITHGATY